MGKPEIRFKGYTDEWEQRKVCNITTSYSGGTPKSGSTEYYDGDIPFIRSGEIYSDKTELFITELGMKNSSAKMVHEGDILYALYGATSGEVSRAKLDGAINQAILAIIPNDDINANFLVEWFRKEKDKITDTYLQGGQGNLSAQIIKELEVTIPSYDEQNKIGLYFEQLNTLITLHQRKCDEVKSLKKYMLQKMFPQNEQKVPEIRFEGFTEAWEQRKLDDVMATVTDYVAAGSFADIKDNVTYLNEIGYAQLVRTVDLKKKFANSDAVYVDENAFKYLWRVNLNEECIVLPNIGANIGEVYYIEPSDLPFANNVLGPNAILLKTDEDNYFIFTSLNTDLFQNQLFENVGSSGQPKFNKTELKSIKLLIPSIEEQKKIGSYFRQLDHLITLHQQKCEELKKIKKFMLQKMFV